MGQAANGERPRLRVPSAKTLNLSGYPSPARSSIALGKQELFPRAYRMIGNLR